MPVRFWSEIQIVFWTSFIDSFERTIRLILLMMVSEESMDMFKLGRKDQALKRAFKALKLNPRKPEDWVKLVRGLAEQSFPEPKKRGRKISWDTKKLHRLYCDVGDVYCQAAAELSWSSICSYLRRSPKYREIWGHYSQDFLRRKFRESEVRIGQTRLGGMKVIK